MIQVEVVGLLELIEVAVLVELAEEVGLLELVEVAELLELIGVIGLLELAEEPHVCVCRVSLLQIKFLDRSIGMRLVGRGRRVGLSTVPHATTTTG